MSARIDYNKASPDALKAMLGLERYVRGSGLEGSLIHLVKMRASQINGCAYCIDMHSRDLLKSGMSVEKLVLVPVWRESGVLFEGTECAALAWAETVQDSRNRRTG